MFNGWLSLASPFAAELMAHQGYDALTIDMQHGLMGYDIAVGMLQAISTTEVTPLVRIPWNDPSMAMRMADAGAYGVICPMVNSRAECEAFVGALRYPPAGYRSYGPLRARVYGGEDYFENANHLVAAIAMIETAQALENLDEILSTPGLDGVYVGPADLSISLGGTQRGDYTDPFLLGKLEQIVNVARRHHIVAGLHCFTPEYAARAVEMGFGLVTAGNDAALMESGARATVQRYQAARAGASQTTGAADSSARGPY